MTSLPLVSLPAMAADDEVATGITSVGPSVFIFVVALALFLTLVFRASAAHVAQRVGSRSGLRRVRRKLAATSKEIFQDIILPGAYGGLARVDFAVRLDGGILCVRVVHCNGTVEGTADDAQWSVVDGAKRRRFLNPLIQNEGRVRAISKAVPGVAVANLVVFTGQANFAAQPAGNAVLADDLRDYLGQVSFAGDPVTDLAAAWQQLGSAVLDDEASRRDFAAQISFG